MSAEIIPLDATQFVDGRGVARDRWVTSWTPALGTIDGPGGPVAVCGTAECVSDDGGGFFDMAFGFDSGGVFVGVCDWRDDGQVLEFDGLPVASFDTFRDFATFASRLLPSMVRAVEEALANGRDPVESGDEIEASLDGSALGEVVAFVFRLATIVVLDRLIAQEES